MIPHKGYFIAEYGRTGARRMSKKYPMSSWDKILRQKLSKGYKIRENFVAGKTESKAVFKNDSKIVVKWLEFLLSCSKQFISRNYQIDASNVSDKEIKEVSMLLDKLEGCLVSEFNQTLIQAFDIIPRKMRNVKDFLATKESDFDKIIRRERKYLESLENSSKVINDSARGEDILKGIKIREANKEEEEQCKKHLRGSSSLFKRAFVIENEVQEQIYQEWKTSHDAKEVYLYHGSRTENILSLIRSGGPTLDIKGAKTTGKMFGFGKYFAPDAGKSLGYTSLIGSRWAKGGSDKGYLLVVKVAYTNALHVNKWESWCSNLTPSEMKRKGYDLLFAHKGQSLLRDEEIVYDDRQTSIAYVIEMSR
ncbi:hypothetical protein [Eubacterium oxidoreducens]|nr:hypothetical protein [Eubacterium oxidoreducens]